VDQQGTAARRQSARLADQPRGDQARLLRQRRRHRAAVKAHQLGRDPRPRRVGVAAVRLDAREAGPVSGGDERADLGAIRGEDDRQVHDIPAEERRSASRFDEVVRQQHDDGFEGVELFVGPVPARAHPVASGGLEGGDECIGLCLGESVLDVQGHRARG